MPLYEYACTKCKTVVEVLQSFDNADKMVYCPHCTGRMKRLFSLPAIQYHYPTGHARAGRGGTGIAKNAEA
jgi:putative FmdB family regulatory protein